MALPKLETLIVVPASGWKLLLTDNDGVAVAITITAGVYYLSSIADGGVRSFLDEVKLRLDNGAGVLYTVALDDGADNSTGKITISVSAGVFTIVWDGTSGTSTALRDLLGYTGNITALVTLQAPQHVRRLHLPNVARTPDEEDATSLADPTGQEETDYVASIAPSGAYAASVFNIRMMWRLRFDNLLGLKTRIALEVVRNESLQRWYRDLMGAGGVPFRYYGDRANDALYATVFLDPDSGRRFNPQLVIAGWVGPRCLFSNEWIVRSYVHVS